MPNSESQRLFYLDAVRAFALILGIFFHASLSFSPMYFGWAVMDISTSSLMNHFMLVSHSFRMELFFLIAGFFTHMSLQKKSSGDFLKSRYLRIGLPLIIGWFLLRPLIVSGWVMGAESMHGEVNIWNGLTAGFASLGSLPTDFLTGTHLWFLYYLLILSTIGILVHLFIPKLPAARQLVNILTRWLRPAQGNPLLALPTVGCLWFMQYWGVDTPDKSLVPNWPVLTLYGVFFSFGWLLHKQKDALENFTQITGENIFTCIVAIIVCIQLEGYQMQTGHPYYLWLKATFLLSYASMMWALVALSIGLFKKYFSRPNRVVRYLADASYWLYFIHLPVVVWLQIAVAELALPWGIKWLAVSGVALGISLLTYDLFIRSTWFGALLNGQKRPRFIFQQGTTLTP